MKRLLIVFMVFCILNYSGIGICDEVDENNSKTVVTMDEVVVSATKTEEKRKDVPNSLIIVDEYKIKESAAQSVGELLANDPGIDWRTYGGYGGATQSINIRGFSSDGTQVFVNGSNVNSPSLGTADVGKIPLNNIEKIEVIKGSGSLLYGTGAAGGIVSIITKRPERDQIDFDISAGYGTQDTYQLSLEQGMYINDDIGYYLTASRRETDGFRDNSDLTHNDISLKLVFDRGDLLDISLYGDYIDRKYGLPGVNPPIGTEPFGFNGQQLYNSETANLLNRGGDKDAHLVLNIKGNPLEYLGFSIKGDYSKMESYNNNRYYTTWPANAMPGSRTWVTNEILGLEANTEIKPINNMSILLGGEYRDYDWDNVSVTLDSNGEDVPGTLSGTNAGLYTKAGFAEAQYRPSTYFKALAGIRYEDHSLYGNENVPRFGIVVNPSRSTVLKFSHGKHYKAPTPNDLYWPYEDWGFGMGTSGNKDLRPETGWHTDATLEQALMNEKIFMTVSYFKWDLNDKIRWVPDSSYFYKPQNLDSYKADGIELGAQIGPIHNMVFSLGYTYLDAIEHISGGAQRPARYTPENLFKGNLNYWTDFGMTADLTLRYTSDRPGYYRNDSDTQPSKILGSYWTTDLKIEQGYNNWIFSIQGNNLFDEEYDTYASSFRDHNTSVTTIESYPGAGRSIFIKVAYEH